VLEEVSRLAFSNISQVLEVKDGALIVKDHASLDEGVLSTVAAVEEHINDKGYRTLRVKQHDRLAALSLLAKILGMNTSKVEVSGPKGGPVRLDVDASSARARIESRLAQIARRQSCRRNSLSHCTALATCTARLRPSACPLLGRTIDACSGV
jgi:hypothetical protein